MAPALLAALIWLVFLGIVFSLVKVVDTRRRKRRLQAEAEYRRKLTEEIEANRITSGGSRAMRHYLEQARLAKKARDEKNYLTMFDL